MWKIPCITESESIGAFNSRSSYLSTIEWLWAECNSLKISTNSSYHCTYLNSVTFFWNLSFPLFLSGILIFFWLTFSIRSSFRVLYIHCSDPLESRKEKTRGLHSKRGTPFCSISRSLDASRPHSFLEEKEKQAAPFRVGKKGIRWIYKRLVTSDRPAAPSCIGNIWKYDLISDDFSTFLRFTAPDAKTTQWRIAKIFKLGKT